MSDQCGIVLTFSMAKRSQTQLLQGNGAAECELHENRIKSESY